MRVRTRSTNVSNRNPMHAIAQIAHWIGVRRRDPLSAVDWDTHFLRNTLYFCCPYFLNRNDRVSRERIKDRILLSTKPLFRCWASFREDPFVGTYLVRSGVL